MHVGTIMESSDATFFEDIFPMMDMATSSNQEMPSSLTQEPVTIIEPAISMEHFENPVEENNELLLGARDSGLQSLLVMIFLCIS